jgi:hypothetical protein
MKTAGDILSTLFDERFMKKAKVFSKFFDSCTDITAKNEIAAASAHSRIKDLDRGILLVEIDHPGWKQILQTKQTVLLNDFRCQFPELGISGISFTLGYSSPDKSEPQSESAQETKIAEEMSAEAEISADFEPTAKGYDAIKDEDFKETLKKLGQSIAAREKKK